MSPLSPWDTTGGGKRYCSPIYKCRSGLKDILLITNTQTNTEEDDKKAFGGFPLHEAVWRPVEAIWENPASTVKVLPRVDRFYRVFFFFYHKDYLFKQPKIDTIMSVTSSTPSRTSAPDWADKKIDNFIKNDYSAATASMGINNYQMHAAKHQHIVWSQLYDSLQTPTPESVEMAMQLAAEDKNAAKIQLQAACNNWH
ncbi:hypothetical protein EOD39_16161 [Acipenser ruthenus]|uniref:Uncharacterized protein n=1 Tax=Acipenser ruthenus TaxID=7906 RepID=A0A444V6N5_ACIRT|nr:hypothetical protein EOD39_16161 [Acipenser ruthenus]